MKKIALAIGIFFMIFILSVIFLVLYLGREKSISGYVYDCFTQRPISNVEIDALQTGVRYVSEVLPIFGYRHNSFTKTDDSGHFTITYTIGSTADLWFHSNGYFDHEVWRDDGKSAQIYLVNDSAIDYTRTVKPVTVELTKEYGNPVPKKIPGCAFDGYF